MLIKTEVEITPRRIADLMVTAIEGGIGYWCEKVELMSAYGRYKVGERHQCNNDEMATFVGVNEEFAGTTYETMYDEVGVHRYTTRDFGRVTGTTNDPRSLVPWSPWYDAEDIYKERVFNKQGNLVPELRIKVTELELSSNKNKDGVYYITLQDLEAAFKLMQEFGTPKGFHFQHFINENEDATTADVWFQLAVFGEVVYGWRSPDMDGEAQKDFDNENRLAQAALHRKRIKIPEGMTMRYEATMDESDRYMCDKVWIDRLTGKEVFRYDAADPANTNSYYGARPDEESFIHRGLDYYALIDAKDAKPMPRFPVYYDGEYDD